MKHPEGYDPESWEDEVRATRLPEAVGEIVAVYPDDELQCLVICGMGAVYLWHQDFDILTEYPETEH